MAKMTVMVEREDGWTDWIHPAGGYRLACCDCGLTHDLQFGLDDDNRLSFRARRNKRSTAAMRRNRKPVMED